MKKLIKVLRWIYGPIAVLMGLSMLTASFFGAIFNILAGLMLTPITGNIIFQKLSIMDYKIAKYGLVFGCASVGMFFVSSGANKAAGSDIEIVEDFLKENQFEEALVFIKENEQKNQWADDFTSYKSMIENATDLDVQKDELASMLDSEFELLSNNNLQKEYYRSAPLNKYFINQLYEIKDQRKQLLAEKKAREADAKRKKMIEKQFSSFNGSHKTFSKMLKDNMNDPSSYKHVQTQYVDQGKTLKVITTYRGKNAFGGVITTSNAAIFDLEGNFIRMAY